jgi:hypothetical protein
VQLEVATVDELFMAAELINPRPGRVSARRAEQHFTNFLKVSFPRTVIAWARAHRWRQEPAMTESGLTIRVG